MHYLLAAVLSNLSYAIADNTNGVVAQKNKPLSVAIWAAIFAVVIFFIPLVIFFQHEIARLTFESALWILGTGVLVALGYLCFISGMNKGSVTLTGVIGGSFPAVTTVIALLLFQEQVSLFQILAILVIILGIILSSMQGNPSTLLRDIKSPSLLFALGAFFLWGLYFALIRIPVEQVGWFLPQYGSSVIGIPLYILIAQLSGEKQVMSKPKLPIIIAVASSLQVAGSMLFNYAISQGPTTIVAPIAGSSPAVFVVIAHFIFKERLNTYQNVGIITALAGIIGLSLLSA